MHQKSKAESVNIILFNPIFKKAQKSENRMIVFVNLKECTQINKLWIPQAGLYPPK